MLGSGNKSFGDARTLLRDAEIIEARIDAKFKSLTVEQQADDELCNCIRASRHMIEQLVDFIDDLPMR